MKKILSLCLCLILLFSFTACGEKQKETMDTETAQAICKDWSDYLALNEKLYSGLIWASEHILAFCEKPDVEALRRALAATEAISATLSELEVPTFPETQSNINKAMEQGIDVTFLELEYSSLENTIASLYSTWLALSRDITTEGFWSYGIEYLQKSADLQLRSAKKNAEYLRHTTNYLLVLFGKDSFEEIPTEDYPTIFPSAEGFITSSEKIEAKVTLCLDELQEILNEYSGLAAIQTANSAILNDALMLYNYDKIFSLALDFGKNGFALRQPPWDALPVFYTYHSVSDDGTKWTAAKDDLSTAPRGLIIEYENVSKAELKRYVDFLEASGFPAATINGNYEDNEPFEYFYVDGTNEFAVKWQDGIATIYITQSNIYICPLWYILYLTN